MPRQQSNVKSNVRGDVRAEQILKPKQDGNGMYDGGEQEVEYAEYSNEAPTHSTS